VHDGALIESEVAGNLSCRPVLSYQKLRRFPSNGWHILVCCVWHVFDDIPPGDAKLLRYYDVGLT